MLGARHLGAVGVARPGAVRHRRLSLDGVWPVELEPPCAPRRIVVPFFFEAPFSGIGLGGEIHERLRYRRRCELPAEWRSSRVLLNFGAVDWRATVTVDGQEVGSHNGGYTHFAFDLGELDPRRAHELVVDVVDPAESGHPSVVLWIVINEDWGRPPTGFQRRLVQGVRAQDPGRLVVDASGWKQLDGADLVDRHDYGDDLSRHCSTDGVPLWKTVSAAECRSSPTAATRTSPTSTSRPPTSSPRPTPASSTAAATSQASCGRS